MARMIEQHVAVVDETSPISQLLDHALHGLLDCVEVVVRNQLSV